MTNVVIKKNGEGSIVRFTVDGHTGFAPAGEDIVCAALSSVTWTVMNGLENVLHIPITYKVEDGYTECSLPELSPRDREKADILLFSMEQFLEDLKSQYGDFIIVNVEV